MAKFCACLGGVVRKGRPIVDHITAYFAPMETSQLKSRSCWIERDQSHALCRCWYRVESRRQNSRLTSAEKQWLTYCMDKDRENVCSGWCNVSKRCSCWGGQWMGRKEDWQQCDCLQNAYHRLRCLSTQVVTLFGKMMKHLQGEASVSDFITEEKYWGCIAWSCFLTAGVMWLLDHLPLLTCLSRYEGMSLKILSCHKSSISSIAFCWVFVPISKVTSTSVLWNFFKKWLCVNQCVSVYVFRWPQMPEENIVSLGSKVTGDTQYKCSDWNSHPHDWAASTLNYWAISPVWSRCLKKSSEIQKTEIC